MVGSIGSGRIWKVTGIWTRQFTTVLTCSDLNLAFSGRQSWSLILGEKQEFIQTSTETVWASGRWTGQLRKLSNQELDGISYVEQLSKWSLMDWTCSTNKIPRHRFVFVCKPRERSIVCAYEINIKTNLLKKVVVLRTAFSWVKIRHSSEILLWQWRIFCLW